MEKKKIQYFISYAHKNDRLVTEFSDKLNDHFGLSKKYEFNKWRDTDIIIGEEWHEQMQQVINECDFGLLLLSSTYFNRKYIREHELPHFLKEGKILKAFIPVGLEAFDLGSDLLGLEAIQIFRYQKAAGEELKFYNELRITQRNNFIIELVKKITLKLDKN